jgi:hypothetical protein
MQKKIVQRYRNTDGTLEQNEVPNIGELSSTHQMQRIKQAAKKWSKWRIKKLFDNTANRYPNDQSFRQ